MAKPLSSINHFLVVIGGIVMIMRAVHGDNGNKDACDEWTNLAHKVSGSEKFHKCTTRTQDCTVMDCSGTTTFSHRMLPAFLKNDIVISYCFGIQINTCNDPLSMDFYLQVPLKNASKTFRIVDDDDYAFRELNYSLGSLGTAYPVFNFFFERNTNSTISLSVTAQVKMHGATGDVAVPGFRIILIQDQIVPVKPCDKIFQDKLKTPPKTFTPDNCQVKDYIPATSEPVPSGGKPSDTLNKECNLEKAHCAERELCDLGLNPPKCICNSESLLSKNGDSCLSTSKLNQLCTQNEMCGINEECIVRTSKMLVCQCRNHYRYNSRRGACIISQAGDDTVDTGDQVYTEFHSTTAKADGAIIRSDSVKTSSSMESHNIPIFVGGGIAAAVAIGLVIWGLVYFVRRRRRHQPLSINERECSAHLVANDNLIM